MTKKTLRVWYPTCGGRLLLTDTELIDDFRGIQARWSYEDFLKKTSDPASLPYRMIVFQYGEGIIQEILGEICSRMPNYGV